MAAELKKPLELNRAEQENIALAEGMLESAKLLCKEASFVLANCRGFQEQQQAVAAGCHALGGALKAVRDRVAMISLLSSTGMGNR